MSRKLRPIPPDARYKVEAAIGHLRAARDLLKDAGAARTVDRVRLAITSAGGAQRHVQRCPTGNR